MKNRKKCGRPPIDYKTKAITCLKEKCGFSDEETKEAIKNGYLSKNKKAIIFLKKYCGFSYYGIQKALGVKDKRNFIYYFEKYKNDYNLPKL